METAARFSDAPTDWRSRFTGGAVALGLEAGFFALIIAGLAVTAAPPVQKALPLINILPQPVQQQETPPPTAKPEDIEITLKAPEFDIERTVPRQAEAQVTAAPSDTKADEPVQPVAKTEARETAVAADVPPRVDRVGAKPDPRALAFFQPDYPPSALRLEQEGTVILRVRVGTDGRILEAIVLSSSGYDSLDRAAVMQALRKWRFTPATENGVAVESWVKAPVRFELKRG